MPLPPWQMSYLQHIPLSMQFRCPPPSTREPKVYTSKASKIRDSCYPRLQRTPLSGGREVVRKNCTRHIQHLLQLSLWKRQWKIFIVWYPRAHGLKLFLNPQVGFRGGSGRQNELSSSWSLLCFAHISLYSCIPRALNTWPLHCTETSQPFCQAATKSFRSEHHCQRLNQQNQYHTSTCRPQASQPLYYYTHVPACLVPSHCQFLAKTLRAMHTFIQHQ